MHDLGRLRDWILHLRQSGARLRGVQQLIGPLDSLAREALFELALDEVPLPMPSTFSCRMWGCRPIF